MASSEVYGFAGSILSYWVLFVWIIILVVPEVVLWNIGLTFLPSKHWCYAIPFYVVFAPSALILSWIIRSIRDIPHYNSLNWVTDTFAINEDETTGVNGEVPWQTDQSIDDANHYLYDDIPDNDFLFN